MVYCTQQLDYDAPFFVREKKTKDGLHSEKVNNTPLLLTEKMISDAIEKEIKKKSNDKKHKITNTPYNRRHKLFLEYLKKGETELCIDIIFRGTKIPFYLMTKDEFSEVITFFNEATKNIKLFDYSSLTVEQITRLLKEIKNEKYINTKDFVYYLMKKKYNELFQEFKEKKN
jgi:L-cysteine desulfidase